MQRIGQNGGLCHGEQKANSYNSRKIASKRLLLLLLLLFSLVLFWIPIVHVFFILWNKLYFLIIYFPY